MREVAADVAAERVTRAATVRDPLVVARHVGGRALLHLFTIVVGALLMVPFAWALIGSFKPETEIKTLPPTFWPSHFVWGNYVQVWISSYFTNWVANTFLITIIATIGAVLTAAFAGYAFARLRFPGREIFFGMTIATMMLPYEVTLIPTYLEYYLLGWLNTFLPLTVPYWLGGGAFFIFLFRQFFMTIPIDLDEAAKIDGADHFQILRLIVLPLSLPVLAAAGILSFIGNWNSFVLPLIILNDPQKFTLSIGLRYFQMQPSGDAMPTDDLLLAGSILMTIPIIAIFFVGQRYFVKGVVLSGLKG
ncbi:MAG TPA: carbohydrate ABC transporter permease [Chloroflexota bacterium]|nr:carbohydrate ABC transporter permease [Chloroflexota bacterium]